MVMSSSRRHTQSMTTLGVVTFGMYTYWLK